MAKYVMASESKSIVYHHNTWWTHSKWQILRSFRFEPFLNKMLRLVFCRPFHSVIISLKGWEDCSKDSSFRFQMSFYKDSVCVSGCCRYRLRRLCVCGYFILKQNSLLKTFQHLHPHLARQILKIREKVGVKFRR